MNGAQMDEKVCRLRAMANDCLEAYHYEIRDGGEPDFPQWAQDLLDILKSLDVGGQNDKAML